MPDSVATDGALVPRPAEVLGACGVTRGLQTRQLATIMRALILIGLLIRRVQ